MRLADKGESARDCEEHRAYDEEGRPPGKDGRDGGCGGEQEHEDAEEGDHARNGEQDAARADFRALGLSVRQGVVDLASDEGGDLLHDGGDELAYAALGGASARVRLGLHRGFVHVGLHRSE